MRLLFGIFAFFLTPPGVPSGGFHWQRTITPPVGAAGAQACVVLDAATFANAAPALRDLRLFQDGEELPYAIEESYDPRALESGTTPDDDRSLYEPALVMDLQTHAPGGHAVRELPAHVPVERLRLEPDPTAFANVSVTAVETHSPRKTPPAETVDGTVDVKRPTLALTLGANLQHPALLTVGIQHTGQAFRRAVFEMRRRSLCYQPRSAAPLTLYLGGGPAVAAKTYSYASDFSTALDRPYATLGPLEPNPDDAAEKQHSHANARRRHLLWIVALAAAFFVFSAARMLRQSRRG